MTVRGFIRLWHIAEATLLLLLLESAWGWVCAGLGLIPLMIVLRAVLIAAVCLVVLRISSDWRLTGRQFLRYWLSEVAAFCRLFFFDQMKSRPSLMVSSNLASHHLIFAHGFLCNDGFWQPLATKAVQAGYSVSGVEMRSAFGDIDDYAEALCREIESLRALDSDINITLIGFSMGGLACRAIPVDVQRQLNLITLYVPLQGTRMAWFASPVMAVNGRQMRPGSAWVSRLNQSALAFRHAAGVWSTHDTIVVPATHARPAFASLMLKGRGHLSAAYDRRLHRHVLRLLAVMSRRASSPSSAFQAAGTQIPD